MNVGRVKFRNENRVRRLVLMALIANVETFAGATQHCALSRHIQVCA
jgi:hypothetical protein